MNEAYYASMKKQIAEVLVDLKKEYAEKKETFFRQVLIASASILGILISFHNKQSESLCSRWVFLLSILLLLFGILSICIILYDYSEVPDRAAKAYSEEVRRALNSDSAIGPAYIPKKKRTVFLEIFSLSSLLMGLISLSIYTAFSLNLISL